MPINIDGVGAGLLLDMGFTTETALLFPILGRLPFIARLHTSEAKAPKNRFVGLVDRTDPVYGSRSVGKDFAGNSGGK